MKEINLSTKIAVYPIEECSEIEKKLIDAAKSATLNSYAPYSELHVGAAALLANGEIITGNNQENAAYPSGLCAERTATFYAHSKYPDQKIEAIAIAAWNKGNFAAFQHRMGSFFILRPAFEQACANAGPFHWAGHRLPAHRRPGVEQRFVLIQRPD